MRELMSQRNCSIHFRVLRLVLLQLKSLLMAIYFAADHVVWRARQES